MDFRNIFNGFYSGPGDYRIHEEASVLHLIEHNSEKFFLLEKLSDDGRSVIVEKYDAQGNKSTLLATDLIRFNEEQKSYVHWYSTNVVLDLAHGIEEILKSKETIESKLRKIGCNDDVLKKPQLTVLKVTLKYSLEVEIHKIDTYLANRELNPNEYFNYFSRFFGGCSLQEKKAAVSALKDTLAGQMTIEELERTHKKALNQGDLGKIYKELKAGRLLKMLAKQPIANEHPGSLSK